MPVLRASASDVTLAIKRNADGKVVGKARAWNDFPLIPSGKGVGFQLATGVREIWFQQPDRPATLGFLGNTGRRFPTVG